MSNLKELEPELRDEVRSKVAPDMTGIVIAKYPSLHYPRIIFLDIRLFNDKIYYAAFAEKWEVIKLNDE